MDHRTRSKVSDNLTNSDFLLLFFFFLNLSITVNLLFVFLLLWWQFFVTLPIAVLLHSYHLEMSYRENIPQFLLSYFLLQALQSLFSAPFFFFFFHFSQEASFCLKETFYKQIKKASKLPFFFFSSWSCLNIFFFFFCRGYNMLQAVKPLLC